MITKSNLKEMLEALSFIKTSADKYEKQHPDFDCVIRQ